MENQEIKQIADGIYSLYKQREDFLIFGLTGRTGSGCTTAADQLTKDFGELQLSQPNNPLSTNDQRKYSIIWNWTHEYWHPFLCIKVSDLIISKVLSTPESDLSIFLNGFGVSTQIVNKLHALLHTSSKEINTINKFWDTEDIRSINDVDNEEIFNLFFKNFHSLRNDFQNTFENESHLYTNIMQTAGDNIRLSGSAISNTCTPDKLFTLPHGINALIKIGRRTNTNNGEKSYFVIDAIRHPFEAIFFRERYSAFYLIGITTSELSRKNRLNHRFNDTQIKAISDKEYPSDDMLKSYEFLVTQNIGACLQHADILINNDDAALDNNVSKLTENLIRYVSLAQHPGLISPTPVERCMQIAIMAKLNSGCISRQVGAAVANADYAVTAIGWNSVPQGQVPCSLRNLSYLKNGIDKDAFSTFEQVDFRPEIKKLKESKQTSSSHLGRPLSYCFKSTYNKLKKPKSHVQPRSLHAEENAFLQIAKYGGMGIKDGYLFSTASPCELCSKKAYQLGIKKIYYIEPYPGIANDHILACGDKKPDLILFTGAIGKAYIQLYQPMLSQKDELEILLTSQ